MLCEVCLRRVNKRQAAVSAIKMTPAYILVQSRGKRSATPDPEDRGMSKRAWERSIMIWRRDLREQLQQLHREYCEENEGCEEG